MTFQTTRKETAGGILPGETARHPQTTLGSAYIYYFPRQMQHVSPADLICCLFQQELLVCGLERLERVGVVQRSQGWAAASRGRGTPGRKIKTHGYLDTTGAHSQPGCNNLATWQLATKGASLEGTEKTGLHSWAEAGYHDSGTEARYLSQPPHTVPSLPGSSSPRPGSPFPSCYCLSVMNQEPCEVWMIVNSSLPTLRFQQLI